MSSTQDDSVQRSSTPHNVQNAALYGATIAFGKPPTKPKPLKDYTGPTRGTATAPSTAATARTSNAERNKPPEDTKVSTTRRALNTGASSANDGATPQSSGGSNHPARRSPITAAGPSAKQPTKVVNRSPKRGTDESGMQSRPRAVNPPNVASRNNTASKNRAPTPVKKKGEPQEIPSDQAAMVIRSVADVKGELRPVIAPKPQRAISFRAVSDEFDRGDSIRHDPEKGIGGPQSLGAQFPPPFGLPSSNNDAPKPQVPPPRRSGKRTTGNPQTSAQTGAPQPHRKNDSTLASVNQKNLAAGAPSSFGPVLPRRHSASPGHNTYREQAMRQIMPHMTGDSLANAMVGAHLAASRNASPTPSHPSSRQTSPHRPTVLRHTLRRQSSGDVDDGKVDERHKKLKLLMHKAPNKHHEGTRKHWRDTVTELERKRYEGLWAANKGLFIGEQASPHRPGEGEDVQNLVVRDVWKRSRLPDTTLEDVWFLVDRREIGLLTKEEFVVGLWLIDQRLKGRKLPARVSDSVWNSVTGLGTRGIRVQADFGKKKRVKLERGFDRHS